MAEGKHPWRHYNSGSKVSAMEKGEEEPLQTKAKDGWVQRQTEEEEEESPV